MKLSKIYSSDISEIAWEWIEPILPKDKLVGRRRKVSLREILNAIFYRADNFCEMAQLASVISLIGRRFMGISACGCGLVCGRELIQS